jgi:hypothetical protein
MVMGSHDNLGTHDQNLSRGMCPNQSPHLLGSRSG